MTGTLLALFRPERATNVSQRTLTFAERVAYQHAIEDVYWRHRIWPKERPDPKPSLDAVMSQAQLEKKVTDYLRKSQALEDYWQRPITAEQLQAEMDRMAKHTKQPEVLRELFAALGNDPFVIAECLARPALAERLLTNWYAYDQRIHGELKQRAEAELQVHPSVEQMKQLSGYSEIEFTKDDSRETVGQAHRLPNRQSAGGAPALQRHDSDHSIKLNSREWDQRLQKLAQTFSDTGVAAGVSLAKSISSTTKIPAGALSLLQEDETRYYATAVIEKSDHHLKLASVSWPKEPLGSWLARAENQVANAMVAATGSYNLPKISEGGGCIDDTWTATGGAPLGRTAHTAVWTGSEMIVWGGAGGVVLNTGGRYNPSTDTWVATSTINAPTGRSLHTALWTGGEMIVWGGTDSFDYFNTGGRYNPTTDSWTTTSTTNAPSGRYRHTAVLTGNQMIVWGGNDGFAYVNTGGKYDPGTDNWTTTSTTNAPSPRDSHTAVSIGSDMIVWGGEDSSDVSNTGGRYNPTMNSWTATSTTSVPSARYRHSAVWTGSVMIVWGGDDFSLNYVNTGGRYNPATNSWAATTITNAPDARESHTAIWTGSEMIVWGGFGDGSFFNTGGKYNPGTNSWTATSTTDAPEARSSHSAVWTGSEMIVWGGTDLDNNFDTGGRYDPSTDGWVPTAGSAHCRYFHTAVWTGTEMIVWGGNRGNFPQNTGGRYNPGIDDWTATSVTNAPTARSRHTAVWTGSEMIIWGGGGDLDTARDTIPEAIVG